MIDPKILEHLPKDVVEAARKQANIVPEEIFRLLGKKIKGDTTFKSVRLGDVSLVVKWLNEHRNASVIAILPDFNTFTYHLIYEEANGPA